MVKKIEVEKDTMIELFNYFSAQLIHPHGNDVFATKPILDADGEEVKNRLGKASMERIHTHHMHRANQLFTMEHEWYHRIGALTGELKYTVVQK